MIVKVTVDTHRTRPSLSTQCVILNTKPTQLNGHFTHVIIPNKTQTPIQRQSNPPNPTCTKTAYYHGAILIATSNSAC